MLPDNPRKPSHKLTSAEAVQAWKYYAQGHFSHRITGHFDTDPGRTYDVLKEKLHPGSKARAIAQLEKENPPLAAKLKQFFFKSKKSVDDNQSDFFQ